MKKILFTFTSLLCAISAVAQNEKPQGKQPQDDLPHYEFLNFDPGDGGIPLPYRLFSPDTGGGGVYPLIIFLHGAGKAQGTDNTSHMGFQTQFLAGESTQGVCPAFIAVPQCPRDDKWFTGAIHPAHARYGQALMDMNLATHQERNAALAKLTNEREVYFIQDPYAVTPSMQMVIGMLDQLLKSHPIDPDRVYVIGNSMGGYGTWAVAMNAADKLAAIVPITGCGDPTDVAPVKALPVWLLHGDADQTVPVYASRAMYRALKEAGNNHVVYTEFPGVGHGTVFRRGFEIDKDGNGRSDILEWLFSISRYRPF